MRLSEQVWLPHHLQCERYGLRDSHINSGTNAHSYVRAKPDFHFGADCNANPDICSNSDAGARANCNSNSGSNAYSGTHTRSNSYANPHTIQCYANGNASRIPHPAAQRMPAILRAAALRECGCAVCAEKNGIAR